LGIEALFRTHRIRNLTFKNRFVLLAMSRYNSPVLRRFERGDFDFVGVGRALLGDHEWLAKIDQGRFDELRTVYPADASRVETLTSDEDRQR
jgi:2,4-dienoyl-CoA reductase-like NADH-dependent reductase (Old Yellow Enzyme family)